jgi:hypothetical protein
VLLPAESRIAVKFIPERQSAAEYLDGIEIELVETAFYGDGFCGSRTANLGCRALTVHSKLLSFKYPLKLRHPAGNPAPGFFVPLPAS